MRRHTGLFATVLRPFACLVSVLAGIHIATGAPGHISLAQDLEHVHTIEAEQDRVVELPGYGKPDFGLFSG